MDFDPTTLNAMVNALPSRKAEDLLMKRCGLCGDAPCRDMRHHSLIVEVALLRQFLHELSEQIGSAQDRVEEVLQR